MRSIAIFSSFFFVESGRVNFNWNSARGQYRFAGDNRTMESPPSATSTSDLFQAFYLNAPRVFIFVGKLFHIDDEVGSQEPTQALRDTGKRHTERWP